MAQKESITKADFYVYLAKQVEALVGIPNKRLPTATTATITLGNVAALLFYELNLRINPMAALQDLPVNWLGFYLLQNENLLVLGPFQGRPACTEIRVGRGVCGVAVETGKTQLVRDVHAFSGHIACDSASKAEVVVPIRNANGTIVGVLDVDSTQIGLFDEVDAQGFEEVARILSKHVNFPMHEMRGESATVYQDHSTLAIAKGLQAPIAVDLKEKEITAHSEQGSALASTMVTSHTKATVAANGPMYVQMKPQHRVVEAGGWEFVGTNLSRILTQEEVQEYERTLGISTIPEIQFPFNTLRIRPVERRSDTPLFDFSLMGLLRSAASFYNTDAYRHTTAPQLSVPVAESWKRVPCAVFDAKVDWAWRNNFFGLSEEWCQLKPLELGMPGLNWELLRDQTLPILFFHSFDIMEDDLHDHGVVVSSVRARVMASAFFVLHRHFIRIDNYRIWLRDVRIYNEYNVRRHDGQPHIVIREEVRTLDISNSEQWRTMGADECASQAELLSEQEYYLCCENDAVDKDWWSTIGTDKNQTPCSNAPTQ
ncbi:GAF domain [Trypanosoma vivax]|uniref:GAF domain-containing protein n=1 Tax=Trypanosoma vivax (strain Y486) TaxID=1055687 RepID=G0TVB4_TRYVY|nr:hypothetical protein TRVL_01316 [Trypanosoma vivax]KAH8613891.1 GAF domain [Trypanosoma vivax]CCC47880.1 conserved hypothetical protein [Trypanosoma vivax Y486]